MKKNIDPLIIDNPLFPSVFFYLFLIDQKYDHVVLFGCFGH